jgi:hypothetical protein
MATFPLMKDSQAFISPTWLQAFDALMNLHPNHSNPIIPSSTHTPILLEWSSSLHHLQLHIKRSFPLVVLLQIHKGVIRKLTIIENRLKIITYPKVQSKPLHHLKIAINWPPKCYRFSFLKENLMLDFKIYSKKMSFCLIFIGSSTLKLLQVLATSWKS